MTYTSAPRWSFSSLLGLASLLSTSIIPASASSFVPLQPPSYPLAVRTPFLQAWLPVTSDNQGLLPACNAQWWDGTSIDWGTIARVDNVSYTIFGGLTGNHAVQTEAQYSSAHSIFLLKAGAVNITADFFSPVSPNNHIRHSLPFSYYTLTAVSNDDKEHIVEIYNELGVNWAGPKGALNWIYDETDGLGYYGISTAEDIPFTANAGSKSMAAYGNTIFSTQLSNTLTNQSGEATNVREYFTTNGLLNGTQNLPAEHNGIVAFAHSLGSVKEAQEVKIVVGNLRDKAVNYLGNIRTPYYRSQYPDTNAALNLFYSDYEDALAESLILDKNITEEATLISSNYSDILRLSVRQMFGGMEITIPYDTLNTSDVLAFLKEISTDGNVNTADVIFPMLPGLIVLAPDWIKYLIQPLLDYQMTGDWPLETAVHDLGSSYPNATGHNGGHAEMLPVESTADMILMTYAYTKQTNDTSFPDKYSPLYDRWAAYLINNTLSSHLQRSTTDAAGPAANQTELGIKSCLALAAYGTMFNSPTHLLASKKFASELYEIGTNKKKTHFLLTHGVENTGWTLAYNLYLDALLNLNIFPQSAFQIQSNWFPQIRESAGVPLNTQVKWGKTDWNSWAAAFSSRGTRDLFMADIHGYMRNGLNSVPFGDRFWVEGVDKGMVAQGVRDRSTVGGHFASLALDRVVRGEGVGWVRPRDWDGVSGVGRGREVGWGLIVGVVMIWVVWS